MSSLDTKYHKRENEEIERKASKLRQETGYGRTFLRTQHPKDGWRIIKSVVYIDGKQIHCETAEKRLENKICSIPGADSSDIWKRFNWSSLEKSTRRVLGLEVGHWVPWRALRVASASSVVSY